MTAPTPDAAIAVAPDATSGIGPAGRPSAGAEPASDVLGYLRHPLDAVVAPRSVAVVGATEKAGSVGRTILWNLLSSPFGGTVYPVNPARPSVLGVKAYPTIAAVPDPVDLAVIVTPAATVPDLVEQCAAAGVKGVIVISAGFKEVGAAGVELESRILATARAAGIRVIGPNCLGVMNPVTGFNATFASGIARPGRVGFISQSGALLTAVLDWAAAEDVGFSAIVSLGSMLDVGWGDLIYYLGDDPDTDSIVIYMETIGDARSFLSAAREVALTKPIIVIKPGRSPEAARAAASHTGSLTGSDDVLDAAFRRAGVLRVDSIADLFHMSDVLAKQPRPVGRRLSIVTNAGGPGVLATDALIAGGGQLAELSPATMARLDDVLPSVWSRNNPIDIIGDAPPERYAAALEIAAADPASDGLLVILTPQAMTDPTSTAKALTRYARIEGKPVFASWMGGRNVEAGAAILREAGIPSFEYPDVACRMFNHMWRWGDTLRGLYETPVLPELPDRGDYRERADALIAAASTEGRTLLTEFESKQVLAAYGIPITDTQIAPTVEDAITAADEIGYPVVLKLYSHTISHKTDVGGVKLNLVDATEVREAYEAIRAAVTARRGAEHFQGVTVQPMINWTGYELIVGSSVDPQFGPVLLFGTGGQLVEVFRDRALALPPLNTTLARRMIEQTTIHRALTGVRGRRAVDLAALEALLVRFSELVAEQPRIAEIDINPLLASPERLIALDARIVLHDASIADDDLPRLAIRPYPRHLASPWRGGDHETFEIRPIRPEDEPALARLHRSLSASTVAARYFEPLELSERTAHDRLTRICFIDYDRELALVAERTDPASGERSIVAVARLSKAHARNEASFTMVVADEWQGRGLGGELLRRLVAVARDERLDRLTAEMLPGNRAMAALCARLGFRMSTTPDGTFLRAELPLG